MWPVGHKLWRAEHIPLVPTLGESGGGAERARDRTPRTNRSATRTCAGPNRHETEPQRDRTAAGPNPAPGHPCGASLRCPRAPTAHRPGPGEPDGRRPRRQRRLVVALDPAGRRAGRASGRVPGDGADRVPGRGPRPALVVRRGLQHRPCDTLALRLADEGLGRRCRSSSATSTAPTAAATAGSASPPAPRRTPPRCCTAARWSPATPSTTCPTTACSTSSATSCPATSRAWSAAARRRRRARDLRGPLAGRRTGRRAARAAGAGLLVVINASPVRAHKDDTRLELAAASARSEAGCPLAYVNMIGGQDELVFDGDSLVVAADGAVLARAPQFAERRARRRPRPPGGSRDHCTARTTRSSRPRRYRAAPARAGAGRAAADRRGRRCTRRWCVGPARLRGRRTGSAR